jgi:3-keto-disaccharide hydrolase
MTMAKQKLSADNSAWTTSRPCPLQIALCIALVGLLWGAASAMDTDSGKEEHWISLFNGKNLDGWTPKITGYELGENFGDTFRVENGVLKVAYDKYDKFEGRFGHLFYKAPFSRYRLRVEYRFVGEQTPGGPGWAVRNSGIMVHCQNPESMGEKQEFPVSIEVQLLGGNGTDERPTGNLCTPGTHVVMKDQLVTDHCVHSSSKTYHGDQWVTAEVEVHGNDTIRHLINGEVVLEYEHPQLDEKDADASKLAKIGTVMLQGGYISLQGESHPCEFRKVEIQPIER